MSSFTYEPPDDSKFFAMVKKFVEKQGSNQAKELLSYCYAAQIGFGSQFTSRRWNEYTGWVSFVTKIDGLGRVTDKLKGEFQAICDRLIPPTCGIGILSVDFIPGMDEYDETEDMIEVIQESLEVGGPELKEILDDDLIAKGKELSQVYQFLFIVENSLRRFVEKTLKDKFGDDYFQKIKLNQQIINGIKARKSEESKNLWIRVRGSSDLYYLDFIEPKFIVDNNWESFKGSFPSQQWIDVKIDELYKCRCLIAHNSDIGEHEKEIIRINYKSILLQILGKGKK